MTVYMNIGGRSAVETAISALKERLETDPCFNLSSLPNEFDHSGDLCEFLVFLLGGAPIYNGRPAADLLSPICGCEDSYERFVDHLVAVFFGPQGFYEGEETLRTMMGRLRPCILAKPATPVLAYSVEDELMRA